MFTQGFDKFVTCDDCIACNVDDYRIVATIYDDDCCDAPDQRQDGFWPSLDPEDAGFLGQGKTIEDWQLAKEQALTVMQAWMYGEWWYVGIVLSVRFKGVNLLPHATSLWGIEANYPGSDNSYLTQVANDLLPDAIVAAKRERKRLVSLLSEPPEATVS